MDAEVLDDIPFEIELPGLLEQLRVRPGSDDADAVARLAEAARAVARPKAACRPAYVEDRAERDVVIAGVTFTSRVLRVNLHEAHRVFATIATCGMELEHWSRSVHDVFERYWADAIKARALSAARRALAEHIERTHRPGQTSEMSPGSLADWPMPQQRPLFALLGAGVAAVGVELTDSFLMVPGKSVTGLLFPTEVRFESCQLCPRENCPGRRAPYDQDLYARRYAPP